MGQSDFNTNENNAYARIEYDADPDRCQHIGLNGQCTLKHIENSQYCRLHAGAGCANERNAKTRNYYLTKYFADKVNAKTSSSQLRDLTDEIGILRVTLENVINQYAHDNLKLLANTGTIAILIDKIEKTMTSQIKLERILGELLDKQTVMQLADEIVAVIAENVTDGNVLDTIANQIGILLERLNDGSKTASIE